MENWSDAASILLTFVSSLNSFNWGEVSKLSANLVQRLDKASSPFPESIARKLLSGLRRKRQFQTMENVADALIRNGQRHSEIYRQYAQSLIDRGSLTGAKSILNSLLSNPDISLDERAETSGLLGRVSKQLYVNARNPSNTRQQSNLKAAIGSYYSAYRIDPVKFYWQGINTVALLNRASKDGVQVEVDVSAAEITDRLAITLEQQSLDRWQRATAVEHAVAIGNFSAAVEHAILFVSDSDVDAFELASLMRQLVEVWELSAEAEPGKTLLPLLQAALLTRPGGVVEIDGSDATASAGRAKKAQHDLEKVFGQDRYQPLDWLKTALTRCSAVGRVESTTGQKIGTGFLVKARDFFPLRSESELLFLTNSHVISPNDNLYEGAISANAARIKFEESGKTTGVGELIWSSPPGLLDATFVTLPQLEGRFENCPLVPDPVPFDKTKPQRVYVIGYPLGGGLSFSLQDSVWLDTDSKVLHYRTPTEPGSSGSPVFDQDYWTVIGLHHKGKKDMPRLNGAPGTYEANEAISIAAIRHATESISPL